ncbi:MAG: hypothetical protein Q8Q01_03645 [archaeon]|nr:hypothetical protein [archaeon]
MTTYTYRRLSDLPESLDDFCGEMGEIGSKNSLESMAKPETEEVEPSKIFERVCFTAGAIYLLAAPLVGYKIYTNLENYSSGTIIAGSLVVTELIMLGFTHLESAKKGYLINRYSNTLLFIGTVADFFVKTYDSITKKNEKK